MSKISISLGKIKTELMQDEEFTAEYERLRPQYEIISQIIFDGKKHNMTKCVSEKN